MKTKISIAMMTSFSGENYKAKEMLPLINYLYDHSLLEKAYGIWDKKDNVSYRSEILKRLKRSKIVKIMFKAISLLLKNNRRLDPYLVREKAFGLCACMFFRTDAEIVLVKPRPSFLIQKLKKRGKIIVIDASENHPCYTEQMLQEECARLGIPVVHNNYTNQKAIKDYEKAILLADYLICRSKFSAQTYITRGFPKERISITGLETGGILIPPRPISEEEIVFVCVANHGILKGTHKLLKIWKEKKIKNRLLIIGKIYTEMKPYIKEIENLKNIEILGSMTREKIAEVYKKNKCMGVLMSVSESYGRTVYECLCTSTPVLVTPTCTCDLVEDGINGYVVSSYEEEAIYQKLSTIISMDKETYVKMSEAVYQTIHRKKDKFEKSYTDALLNASKLGRYQKTNK